MEKSCYILMFCQDELAQGIINHLVMKLYQVTDTDMGNNEEEFVYFGRVGSKSRTFLINHATTVNHKPIFLNLGHF